MFLYYNINDQRSAIAVQKKANFVTFERDFFEKNGDKLNNAYDVVKKTGFIVASIAAGLKGKTTLGNACAHQLKSNAKSSHFKTSSEVDTLEDMFEDLKTSILAIRFK